MVRCVFLFCNMPHFMSSFSTETNLIDAQYISQTVLDNHLCQNNIALFLSMNFIHQFGVSSATSKYVEDVDTYYRSVSYIKYGMSSVKVQYRYFSTTTDSVMFYTECRTMYIDDHSSHRYLFEPLIKIIIVI